MSRRYAGLIFFLGIAVIFSSGLPVLLLLGSLAFTLQVRRGQAGPGGGEGQNLLGTQSWPPALRCKLCGAACHSCAGAACQLSEAGFSCLPGRSSLPTSTGSCAAAAHLYALAAPCSEACWVSTPSTPRRLCRQRPQAGTRTAGGPLHAQCAAEPRAAAAASAASSRPCQHMQASCHGSPLCIWPWQPGCLPTSSSPKLECWTRWMSLPPGWPASVATPRPGHRASTGAPPQASAAAAATTFLIDHRQGSALVQLPLLLCHLCHSASLPLCPGTWVLSSHYYHNDAERYSLRRLLQPNALVLLVPLLALGGIKVRCRQESRS